MSESTEQSQQPSPAESAGPTPETLRKRKVAMLILSGIFLLIAIIWLINWCLWGRFELYTDDAYVNGNIVQLMPQISGTVVEINTDDTQLVTKGQVIIKLDAADTNIALQRAKADLAQTVRQVHQYFENAAQLREALNLSKANLVQAQLDFKRRSNLIGERAISREEMQHVTTSVEGAQASYNVAVHNLTAAVALVENAHLYTHPLVEAAKANLRVAYLNHQRTTIVAPVTGYVAKRSVQLGQQVNMNSAMLAIIPLHDIWVDANYKESSLENIRIGQAVNLYADAYSGAHFHGKIMGLNAGTGSAFSLLPPQNATGNWIKIVQRLPVRIQLDPEELQKTPLQIGLSMRVTTNIKNQGGSRLAKKTEPKLVYKTSVYKQQLADIEPIISAILQENAPDMFLARANSK